MAFKLQQAERKGSWARVALIGPSGSGKSFSGLSIAAGLGGKFGTIDTERGSLNKYAGEIENVAGEKVSWSGIEMDSFSPEAYVEALDFMAAQGFTTLMVDSLSHAWIGKDGALEQVDKNATRNQGNSFAAWRTVTPMHNQLVEALIRYPGHLIVTMRSKSEWVVEKDEQTGKNKPRKIGTAAIQRDGLEYEFDIVGDMNLDHELVISKTRARFLDNAVIKYPNAKLGSSILDWLGGNPPVIVPDKSRLLDQILTKAKSKGMDKQALSKIANDKYGSLMTNLDSIQLQEVLESL